MRVLLVSANREMYPSPVVPIGILYVASAVRDGGQHDVEVVDLCFAEDPLATIREVCARYRPEVVGLGLRNLHDNSYGSSEPLLSYYESVATTIREAMPRGCRLVLGGAAITLQPTTMLERLQADHVIVGEGERAFRALVDGLAQNEPPPPVLYAAAVRGSRTSTPPENALGAPHSASPLDHLHPTEGEASISVTSVSRAGDEPGGATSGSTSRSTSRPDLLLVTPSKLIRDRASALSRENQSLDDLLMPARDLVDPRYFEVEGTDNVQTKRGCAFQCTYCDYPDLEGRKVRVRSPGAVAEEMLACSRAPNVSHVFIVDSVFNVPRSHALAICDELIARGSPIPWVCYVSPASLDEEVIERMAKAGCIGAEVGTDTGSERVRARLNKPFSLDQVRRVRAAFKEHGIADCHTFVLGAEEETVEEAKRTLAFVEELDPDVAVFVVFMEDREEKAVGRAAHREALLALLAEEAPRRPGWVVPELGVRFGPKVARLIRRERMRGPSWVHLAQNRRAAREIPRA